MSFGMMYFAIVNRRVDSSFSYLRVLSSEL